MGIGVSVLLIAVGAILAFGVNAATDVANIDVIGYILMACGALGLVIALVAMGGWRRNTVVEDRVVERESVDRTV
jgi:phosphate/sulfate permease